MRLLPHFLLLCLSCSTFAASIVPGSESPDGKFVLGFEEAAKSPSGALPKVWFVQLPGKQHFGTQLVPSEEQAYSVKSVNGTKTLFTESKAQKINQLRQMMYESLVYAVMAAREKRVTGDNYKIHWDQNSREVTISAGAHKFSHSTTFKLQDSEFVAIKDFKKAQQDAAANP
jgi:hypothetical protein